MLLNRLKHAVFVVALSPLMTVSSTQAFDSASCTSDCGEGCDSCYSSGCSLDPHTLFNKVAGDKSLFSGLKDQEVGGIKYSVGGALRYRYMSERNRLRPPGGNADYSLWRFSPHMKMQLNDRVGGFVEGIDASAFNNGGSNYTRVGIDVNRLDFLRYYGEVKLLDDGDSTLKYRYGRQFLKYGGQRLLSSLAWSNTFRNFEGHKLMYSNGDWDVDAFMMKSVNAAAGGSGFGVTSLDSADEDRWMSGVYSTYKGMKSSSLDLYWLYFNERNDNLARMDGERHTLGVRFAGSQAIKECDSLVGTWAWDLESAYQFGRDQFGGPGARDVSAGMAAASLGYTFNEAPWSPALKSFYYWSSGSSDPTSGDINTFYTMYPLGHAYWGLIDQFSGQNMHDIGLTASVKPHKKLTLATSYHVFQKANDGDNAYNIVGAPFAGAGSDLGQEIDLLATIPVSKNFNVQAGYFWFFYGDALAGRKDARLAYLQTVWKF